VQVLGQGVVGPYETVTLHSSDPNALTTWLTMHGFDIPTAIAPTIDAYVLAGFDFIALRLRPTCGVQAMQPVRVRTPGADPTLPLRMVAAGVGARVDVALWVIGDGRWEPANFPATTVDDQQLRWNAATNSSNYEGIAEATMAQANGTTWVTEFAGVADLSLRGLSSRGANPGVAQAYYGFCNGQALSNGSPVMQPAPCAAASIHRVGAAAPLADPGDGGAEGAIAADDAATDDAADGGSQPDASGDEGGADALADAPIEAGDDAAVDGSTDAAAPVEAGDDAAPPDASSSGPCASYDDLSAAVAHLGSFDVWVTRLRAKLPVEALAKDLILQASSPQMPVSNVHSSFTATLSLTSATVSTGRPGSSPSSGQSCESGSRHGAFEGIGFVALSAAVAGVMRRRRRAL
jgi:hypothetical protein